MANILIISPGHAPDRISRQPWAYLQGLADQLSERDHNVSVIGDGPQSAESSKTISTKFQFVESVRDPAAIAEAARAFDPDVCLWSLAPIASLYLTQRVPKIADTMVAVVPGPLYSPRDIASQLSRQDFSKLPSYASLVASSCVPQAWFSYFLRSNFDFTVAPTTTIVDKVSLWGYPREKALHVPHGLDSGILTKLSDEEFRDEIPSPPDGDYVVNFGPPRPIRGAQDFVEAVLMLREAGHDVTGVMLARIDDDDDRDLLEEIKGDLVRRGHQGAILITDAYLTPHELKTYICGATAAVLPYRIVQSTVPVSIIEGLGLGCPVITTDIAGARELAPSATLTVSSGSVEELVAAIGRHLSGGHTTTEDQLTAHLPTWDAAVGQLEEEISKQ
ncbi:glycosyltransferase [Natronorubrum aibiense]|uniref:Glycosyltransferase n=1 Tax=Natronorubrum aibiense TaxID=348826 RepID=A0A5P9P2C4_9EURY|nr:glycosyltransferase [Natronorubrum aibiense]QFU82285.1 glycosyltransferase [Natronorubrum aibiense]